MMCVSRSKCYFQNSAVLFSSIVAYIILYPHTTVAVEMFMVVVIMYLIIANIIALILRYYGVRYTNVKPKLYVIANKTYFRISLPIRLSYPKYYAYRCWDHIDLVFHNSPLDDPNEGFKRYYRTEDGPLTAIGSTYSPLYATCINLINVIGCFFIIAIFKE